MLAEKMHGGDSVSSRICTEVCILNLRLWNYLSLKYELTASEMQSHVAAEQHTLSWFLGEEENYTVLN